MLLSKSLAKSTLLSVLIMTSSVSVSANQCIDYYGKFAKDEAALTTQMDQLRFEFAFLVNNYTNLARALEIAGHAESPFELKGKFNNMAAVISASLNRSSEEFKKLTLEFDKDSLVENIKNLRGQINRLERVRDEYIGASWRKVPAIKRQDIYKELVDGGVLFSKFHSTIVLESMMKIYEELGLGTIGSDFYNIVQSDNHASVFNRIYRQWEDQFNSDFGKQRQLKEKLNEAVRERFAELNVRINQELLARESSKQTRTGKDSSSEERTLIADMSTKDLKRFVRAFSIIINLDISARGIAPKSLPTMAENDQAYINELLSSANLTMLTQVDAQIRRDNEGVFAPINGAGKLFLATTGLATAFPTLIGVDHNSANAMAAYIPAAATASFLPIVYGPTILKKIQDWKARISKHALPKAQLKEFSETPLVNELAGRIQQRKTTGEVQLAKASHHFQEFGESMKSFEKLVEEMKTLKSLHSRQINQEAVIAYYGNILEQFRSGRPLGMSRGELIEGLRRDIGLIRSAKDNYARVEREAKEVLSRANERLELANRELAKIFAEEVSIKHPALFAKFKMLKSKYAEYTKQFSLVDGIYASNMYDTFLEYHIADQKRMSETIPSLYRDQRLSEMYSRSQFEIKQMLKIHKISSENESAIAETTLIRLAMLLNVLEQK
jgi:hypothetical protein